MRSIIALALFLGVALIAHGAPSRTADPVLLDGLQTIVSNGVDAGVHLWYPDRSDVAADMSAKLSQTASGLGVVIDAEVVAVQPVAKRVTRYYLAVYYTRGPVWVRLERYQSTDKAFFLPLKCSVNPDDILPGYVTEFFH